MPIRNILRQDDLPMNVDVSKFVELQKNEEKKLLINQKFFEYLQNMDHLPFKGTNINWYDNKWDFRPYLVTNINPLSLVVNFSNTPIDYVDNVKEWAITRILNKDLKIQSLNNCIYSLNEFLKFCVQHSIYSVADITPEIIHEYRENVLAKDVSNRTKSGYIQAVRSFFVFYSVNISKSHKITPEIEELLKNPVSNGAIKAEIYNNHRPNFDKEYFRQFNDACWRVASDKSESTGHRGIAAMYILLGQTGLRIGELLDLKVDAIQTDYCHDGSEIQWLKYRTWKGKKGSFSYKNGITIITEAGRKAFELLIKIYAEKREYYKTDYLFLGRNLDNVFPIHPGKWRQMTNLSFYRRIDKYFKIIDQPEEKFQGITNKHMEKTEHVVAVPVNHQFRTFVCSDIYNRSDTPEAALEYVKMYMSHLSMEMESSYVYPKDKNIQENRTFSVKIVKGIVTGDLRIIGPDNGLIESVNKFINENNYNVKEDVDTICNELLKKIPIREKSGGVCIKSNGFMDCRNDKPTDEFHCACDVCPNLYHFYYMLAWTYKRALNVQSAVKHNDDNGFVKAANKGKNELVTIANQLLIPEIEETKRMISKYGADEIIKKHPEMEYVIENIDKVTGDAEKWGKILTKPSMTS